MSKTIGATVDDRRSKRSEHRRIAQVNKTLKQVQGDGAADQGDGWSFRVTRYMFSVIAKLTKR